MPADDAPRLIGRAVLARGRWLFDPSRRWRGGRRDLVWSGRHTPEDGDFCIAEVPEDGPAHLVEVLGADDRPEWDDDAVASQYRLRRRFPRPALAEADAHHEPGARERHGRLDLRERLAFTIDPADARDHDDALSVEDLPGGRHEVGIHIADVSHYVRAGTALDDEALLRGTSCYLPGGVVPMLPERLSGDLCSLRPGRDRLALSVLAELDAHGTLHGYRLKETVIRSAHRLAYEDVQAHFDGGPPPAPELAAPLATLRRLAQALRGRREKAGALALEVPETKVTVDARGNPVRIERREQRESHRLIEEFMLLANRCVGEEGARRGSGILFRVHDGPNPKRLADLDQVLKVLGLPRPHAGDDPARVLQGLLSVHLDPPRRRLLHRLVLRALARARYLEKDTGHFGLATREYCHFTSPIRRYPDLHNHRLVRAWIQGRSTAAWDPVELAERAAACTGTEQVAMDAEREAVRVKGLRHLDTRLGERASGTIAGFVTSGFFVELDDVPVDGFVRPSMWLDDRFDLDMTGVRMVGRRSRRRFTLGDRVQVVIARVDVPARECDLALEDPRRRNRRRTGRG